MLKAPKFNAQKFDKLADKQLHDDPTDVLNRPTLDKDAIPGSNEIDLLIDPDALDQDNEFVELPTPAPSKGTVTDSGTGKPGTDEHVEEGTVTDSTGDTGTDEHVADETFNDQGTGETGTDEHVGDDSFNNEGNGQTGFDRDVVSEGDDEGEETFADVDDDPKADSHEPVKPEADKAGSPKADFGSGAVLETKPDKVDFDFGKPASKPEPEPIQSKADVDTSALAGGDSEGSEPTIVVESDPIEAAIAEPVALEPIELEPVDEPEANDEAPVEA